MEGASPIGKGAPSNELEAAVEAVYAHEGFHDDSTHVDPPPSAKIALGQPLVPHPE
jgi:hypothetical protein